MSASKVPLSSKMELPRSLLPLQQQETEVNLTIHEQLQNDSSALTAAINKEVLK
jgi:hypothetical protein